jgi:hypothetical protein
LVSLVTTVAEGFAVLDSGELLRLARAKAPLVNVAPAEPVNVAPVDDQYRRSVEHALKELRAAVELVSSRVPPELARKVEEGLKVVEAAFAERWLGISR